MLFQSKPMVFRKLHTPPVVVARAVLTAKLDKPGFTGRTFGGGDVRLELDGSGASIGNSIDKRVCQSKTAVVRLRYFTYNQTATTGAISISDRR